MSALNQFGIAYDAGGQLTELAMSMKVTDEIAILLMQQGVDVSSINKLSVPSGFTNVGQMSILCYLPINMNWMDLDLWAIVGPCKWKLSNNYRIHRVFAQPSSGVDRTTLAIVSVDDWRYNLNIFGSNNTGQSSNNKYGSDFSIASEDVTNEIEGDVPVQAGSLDSDKLHLWYDLNWLKTLDNSFNAWGYEREMSDAELADRVLMSCGAIACPQLQLREPTNCGVNYESEYVYGSQEPSMEYNDSTHWMVAEYVGDGWICATQLWNRLSEFYKSGQLECAFGSPERNDDWAEDDFPDPLDRIPEEPEVLMNKWMARAEDGNQEIPSSVDVNFPARTPTGKYVMYQVNGCEHGKPFTGNQHYSYSGNAVSLTDHIKTKTTEIPASELAVGGITYITIDPLEADLPLGLTQARKDDLLQRALHLSKCYYARYYACSGTAMFVGWHHARAIPGCTLQEYGFSSSVQYTRILGGKHNPAFGFSTTSFSNSSVVTGGGLLLNRPDGQAEVITGGASSSNDLLCSVVGIIMDAGGCVAKGYVLERLSDEETFGNDQDLLKPTDRSIPNMCYEPLKIGDLVLFAFVPKGTADDEPEIPMCDQGGCNYLFIAGEEVQTQECQ